MIVDRAKKSVGEIGPFRGRPFVDDSSTAVDGACCLSPSTPVDGGPISSSRGVNGWRHGKVSTGGCGQSFSKYQTSARKLLLSPQRPPAAYAKVRDPFPGGFAAAGAGRAGFQRAHFLMARVVADNPIFPVLGRPGVSASHCLGTVERENALGAIWLACLVVCAACAP